MDWIVGSKGCFTPPKDDEKNFDYADQNIYWYSVHSFDVYRDGEFAFKYTKKRKAEDMLAFMKK